MPVDPPEVPLIWHLAVPDASPAVLSVDGPLYDASGEAFHLAVMTIVRRHHGTLLIDVSAMTVGDPAAVTVFTRIMDDALQWPDVAVLVCAPPTEVGLLLTAEVLDPRLMFSSVAAGRSAAVAMLSPVTEDLLPVSGAGRRARDVVTDACLRWDEPDLIGPAALVVTELVTNAAVHANTMMTVQARLRLCHLHIAVFDGSTVHAVHGQASTQRPGGRGIHLVAAYSAAWGSTPLPTGKVVWSAIIRPASSL